MNNFRQKTYIAKTPFRLDLVMGGVSDLDWWNNRNGDCLSISCDLNSSSIQVEAQTTSDFQIELQNFNGINDKYTISLLNIGEINIARIPIRYKLAVSAIISAAEIIINKQITMTQGLIISNKSSRAKGMGGSGAIASCIISILCQANGLNLDFTEIVAGVIQTENRASIGGGWEDIVGVYNPGINRIRYRPNNSSIFSIEKVMCNTNFYDQIQSNLLLVDSRIPASTAGILSSAKSNFLSNPEIVISNTENIQQECDRVVDSLLKEDLESVGLSLNRQRKYWNIITNGFSANPNVQDIFHNIILDIIGFREAGAGGGGIVLVICKPKKYQSVIDYLNHNGKRVIPWEISKFGLSVHQQ